MKEEMRWSKEQQALLVLMRAGLWEREPDDVSLFPLSAESWEQVWVLARMQTIAGIVYSGICLLPEVYFPPQDLLVRWVAEVDAIERKNKQLDDVAADLDYCFGCWQIHAVLQKGQGVARYYEKPLWRQCGDIDLFFPSKIEEKIACRCMVQEGCSLHKAADGSVCYKWQDVLIEHHPHLVDIQNPFKREYLRRLIEMKGYVRASHKRILLPVPVLEVLLLNAHILKHALGLGVGLRQFCDLARAYYVTHAAIDAQELQEVYRRAGIEKWSKLLHAFLMQYIGLPAGCLPYPDKEPVPVDDLAQMVFEGGNFGQYKEGRQQAMRSGWKRKWHTFAAFCSNYRFACRYAPAEGFWTVVNLMRGQ